MKIGVFGDSFTNLKFEENTTPTWVDILNERYDTTNFGVSGSNLYYSVNKFKEEQHRFDKIILVITAPGRLQLSNWIETLGNPNYRYATNLSNVENQLARWYNLNTFDKDHLKINLNLIKAFEAARDYFIYLDNKPYNNFIQKLMIDEVLRSRSDTIMIPVDVYSFGTGSTTTTLSDIYKKEMNAWNENDDSIHSKMIEEAIIDIRNCHLTAENNAILAEKVEEWIDGSPVEIKLDDFVTPMNKEFYIRKL